jgi:outer membrane protein assembly factor BamB
MKFKLLFLFILIAKCIISPQGYKYAIISDIKCGSQGSEDQLKNIVGNINSRQEIKFVVVVGNATLSGKDKEFLAVKKILDNLKVDYYPVPGFNDMKYSPSGGSKSKELWEDDKFSFEVSKQFRHIGINNFSPWMNKGHYSIEDLHWLDTVLTATGNNEEVYFYSSCPIDEKNIGNWYEITNRLENKNLRAIFYPGLQNKITRESSVPQVIVRPSITKEQEWNYTVVENGTDSLRFYQISRDTLQELWGSLGKTDKTIVARVDSTGFINYSAEILWQKEMQKEMYAPVLATEDKIFTASFNGEVTCFDLKGDTIWQHHLDRTVLNGFVRVKDLLFIGTYEGDLFSLDVNTGQVIQVIGIGEPITSRLVIADIHYNDTDTKGIIAGTANGNVFFYEVYLFEQIWVNNSSNEMITTNPLPLKEKILLTSRDGTLYNLDINSGVLNWKWSAYNSNPLSSPVTNGKNVFVSSTDRFISSIDLLRGETAWRKNDHNSNESLILSNDKQKLLIKSLNDYFIIADAGTGRLDKKIRCGFGTDPDPSDVIQIKNQILFGAGNGVIYRIDKNYKSQPLLYLGNARITTLTPAGNNLIAAANCDGRIILFKLK